MKSLEVYKIQTDYSILHYAAEKDFGIVSVHLFYLLPLTLV